MNKFKKTIKNIIRFIIFLGFGIFLLWLVYKNENLTDMLNSLKNADYKWIGLSMILSFLSHWSRAVRWKMLIEPLGYKPKTFNTFMAVTIMYLANIAIPRSGEVTRCGIMKQYEKIPFTQLLGTVFLERLVDFLILIFLLLFVLISQFTKIIDFFHENVGKGIIEIFTSANFGIALIITFTAMVLMGLYFHTIFRHSTIYKKIKKTQGYIKIQEFVLNFIKGLNTIKTMNKKWQFIGHSIFIYMMYFLMIYTCFFAFKATSELSIMASLAIFVMSSFGMVAPSPGGIGTWHFMAIGTMMIYQVPATEAKIFAVAAHSSMMILLIFLGFLSLILLPLFNKTSNHVK